MVPGSHLPTATVRWCGGCHRPPRCSRQRELRAVVHVEPRHGRLSEPAAGPVVESDPAVTITGKQDQRRRETPLLNQVIRVQQRRLAVLTADAPDLVERNVVLAPRRRHVRRERVPRLRDQATVLNPQDVQQRGRQANAEPTLGVLDDRVGQRRLNPIHALAPERRLHLIEPSHKRTLLTQQISLTIYRSFKEPRGAIRSRRVTERVSSTEVGPEPKLVDKAQGTSCVADALGRGRPDAQSCTCTRAAGSPR